MSSETNMQVLIPPLPNDVASRILSFIPFAHHAPLKQTCKSWHEFFTSQAQLLLRRHLGNTTTLICLFPGDPSVTTPYLFDVRSIAWNSLPLVPSSPGSCDFNAVFLFPHLYILGGTLSSSAFRFDFIAGSWDSVSPPQGSFACSDISRETVVNMKGSECRVRTGSILVVENEKDSNLFDNFMLHESEILRYDTTSKCWVNETKLPTKVPNNPASVSFIALGKELLVMSLVRLYDEEDSWLLRRLKRIQTLHIQIYHPQKRTWRSLQIKPPFTYRLNFRTSVMCTLQL